VQGLGDSTLAKVLVERNSISLCLRYGLLPPERVSCLPAAWAEKHEAGHVSFLSSIYLEWPVGSKELACGGQAFIATSLFDPSMSALPIIPKQNSVSVGLFTH
jgi:hypothetical protein